MHTDAAATHAVLLRSGRPVRVSALTDWQALADMRSAASLSIGIYSVEHVTASAVQDAEDIIAGTRAALVVVASWPALLAA